MTKEHYTEGVLRALRSGTEPSLAFQHLSKILKREKREVLFPDILFLVLKRSRLIVEPRVTVASEEVDVPKKLVGEKIIDPTLIGGYRYENGEALIDTSYKRALIAIYKNATT
jgi:hypothetical protein